jgi:hypothetical protein
MRNMNYVIEKYATLSMFTAKGGLQGGQAHKTTEHAL